MAPAAQDDMQCCSTAPLRFSTPDTAVKLISRLTPKTSDLLAKVSHQPDILWSAGQLLQG